MSGPTSSQLLSESLFGTELKITPAQGQHAANNLDRNAIIPLPPLQPGETPGPDRLYGRIMNAEFMQLLIHVLYCVYYVLWFMTFQSNNSNENNADAVLFFFCVWHIWIIVFRFFQCLSMYINYPAHSARIDPNNRFGVNHLVPFNMCVNVCFVGVSGFIMMIELIWSFFWGLSFLGGGLPRLPGFMIQLVVTLNAFAAFKKANYNNRYANFVPQQPPPQFQQQQQQQTVYYNQPNGYSPQQSPPPQQPQPFFEQPQQQPQQPYQQAYPYAQQQQQPPQPYQQQPPQPYQQPYQPTYQPYQQPQGYQAPTAAPPGRNNPYEPLV